MAYQNPSSYESNKTDNSKSLPGILRLTPDIRHHIYVDLGLAHMLYNGTPRPGVYDLSNWFSFAKVTRSEGTEPGFKTFHGLLLSCRTLYAEASALFYSSNRFIVRYPPRPSLTPLQALTPHALRHLTHLKVVLNQASCHASSPGADGRGFCCENVFSVGECPSTGRFPVDKCQHDLPLDHEPNASRNFVDRLMEEWHATAARLAANTTPGRLELALVCDVRPGAVDMAKRVLDGLLSFPALKDCHIRLCRDPDPALQTLAQEAVIQARRLTPPALPPPARPACSNSSSSSSQLNHTRPNLFTLPPEIRTQIFQYTDLVTPFCELNWGRKARRFYSQREACVALQDEKCPPKLHHGCQFLQCAQVPGPDQTIGCFCRYRHTAASSTCRCWDGTKATALMFVCRTLLPDALRVGYGHNRIVVLDHDEDVWPSWPWPPGDYPHQRFAISEFLRDALPPYCRQYIRFLEVVFAPITGDSRPRDGHPALTDWEETVEWIKRNLNVAGLTLRVVTTRTRWDQGQYDSVTTPEQFWEVVEMCRTLLTPIQALVGATHSTPTSDTNQVLAGFYANIAFPTVTDTRQLHSWEWHKRKDRMFKRRAEQFVMGVRYRDDATLTEPRDSAWAYLSDRTHNR
ncbi:hypothetical protein B0J18DRAFT_362316 [Chaetomium sp. MPI-SDFR-AT-0129]|nr:hypothetical protein B0J18DRAFT_362316 [Chaetomium sp. MPI-SDFR-AT-0129]